MKLLLCHRSVTRRRLQRRWRVQLHKLHRGSEGKKFDHEEVTILSQVSHFSHLPRNAQHSRRSSTPSDSTSRQKMGSTRSVCFTVDVLSSCRPWFEVWTVDGCDWEWMPLLIRMFHFNDRVLLTFSTIADSTARAAYSVTSVQSATAALILPSSK